MILYYAMRHAIYVLITTGMKEGKAWRIEQAGGQIFIIDIS
jgi:hypothetical protein